VFAFAAYLIEITGLIGYFEPNPKASNKFGPDELLKVVLNRRKRKKCAVSSKYWRQNGKPDRYTMGLWKVIHVSASQPIKLNEYLQHHADSMIKDPTPVPAPGWWDAVFQLLIISDEACAGIGHFYSGKSDADATDFEEIASVRIRKSRASEASNKRTKIGNYDMVSAKRQIATLAAAADRTVVCVQPKGRVSEVGCTLRNLSRNLSITGPTGSVRCSWQQLAGEPRGKTGESLDILLIPLPYDLNAISFKGSSNAKKADRWANFSIEQSWIDTPEKRENLREMVKSLIREALQDVASINAVIFPEYALDYELFTILMDDVYTETHGAIEFMIAGSSSNCEKEDCNCVLTALWEDKMADMPGEAHGSRIRLISQKKHHRWKIDKPQIKNYGLASSLRPNIQWWETHNIGQRELNFFQFRKDAVFASLICEDLARNDPCHGILRSVAPNLVFSLLMDGPQLTNRWPARYASTLADDPGCTVLTFTSFGLLKRGNENSEYKASNSVGLLRDTDGATREIALATEKKGILLTLGSEKKKDYTIDGRRTTNASSWYFISQKNIGTTP